MSERMKRVTEWGERVGRTQNKRGVIFGGPCVKREAANGRVFK